MYKNIELESTKYWAASLTSEHKLFRRAQRRVAIERFAMFTLFAATAGVLGYMLANGNFDNVDVIGTLERFGYTVGINR